MTAQIEVKGNKIFDDVNQNNVNRENTVNAVRTYLFIYFFF